MELREFRCRQMTLAAWLFKALFQPLHRHQGQQDHHLRGQNIANRQWNNRSQNGPHHDMSSSTDECYLNQFDIINDFEFPPVLCQPSTSSTPTAVFSMHAGSLQATPMPAASSQQHVQVPLGTTDAGDRVQHFDLSRDDDVFAGIS